MLRPSISSQVWWSKSDWRGKLKQVWRLALLERSRTIPLGADCELMEPSRGGVGTYCYAISVCEKFLKPPVAKRQIHGHETFS
jgi:hypothetical protein